MPPPQLQCSYFQDTGGVSSEGTAGSLKCPVHLAKATCLDQQPGVERCSPHVPEAWQQHLERMQQLDLHSPVLIGFNQRDLSKLADFWAMLDFIQQRLQTVAGQPCH